MRNQARLPACSLTDRAPMPLKRRNRPRLRRGFPHLHRHIPGASSNTLSVRRPGDSIHSGKMTVIGEDVVTCGSVPDLHRMVPGARGNALPIGGPGDSSYYIRMTAIGEDSASRDSV